MRSRLCPIRNVTPCKRMEEGAIKGLASHYSICPSQLNYQMKHFWLKASVLYEQLSSSVPDATLSHTQRYVYDLCILNNPLIALVKKFFNTFFFKFNK